MANDVTHTSQHLALTNQSSEHQQKRICTHLQMENVAMFLGRLRQKLFCQTVSRSFVRPSNAKWNGHCSIPLKIKTISISLRLSSSSSSSHTSFGSSFFISNSIRVYNFNACTRKHPLSLNVPNILHSNIPCGARCPCPCACVCRWCRRY